MIETHILAMFDQSSYFCCQLQMSSDDVFISIRIIYQIQMEEQKTTTSLKVEKQVREVYDVLMRYGFPGLMSVGVLKTGQEIEAQLSDYFQPNIKRQNLIEWLILNINPHYSSELNNRANKKKVIMSQLWQFGVMPYSKHTANLDYQKYIDGLIGHENAVSLIHNLCVLLKQSNQFVKVKEDTKFNGFVEQVINCYDCLVNVEYDPYKISFPAVYQQMGQEQFQEEYQGVLAKIEEQRSVIGQDNFVCQVRSGYQAAFKDFQDKKESFAQQYEAFVIKIRQVVENNAAMIDNWSQMPSVEGRTLNISPNLSKVFRKYRQKIKISKVSASKLREERVNIKNIIESINETVCL